MADYQPEPGKLPAGIDLSHGVIRATFHDKVNTVDQAVARRLSPHGSGQIDCHDYEVLLPRHAPDHLRRVDRLVHAYEDQLIPGQQDLIGIATARFPDDMLFHEQWERARLFVRTSFNARDLAALLVHHVPALAGRSHKSHVHILYPVRRLRQVFGPFLILDKAILAAEWSAIVDGDLYR